MHTPVEVVAEAGPGASNGTPRGVKSSFDSFCTRWMGKLRSREKHNASRVRIVQRQGWYVGEFTGYGTRPLKCTATPTGNARNPFVGRIVYEEIQYQKAGQTVKEARASAARAAARTEVTEIFRYDGTVWVY